MNRRPPQQYFSVKTRVCEGCLKERPVDMFKDDDEPCVYCMGRYQKQMEGGLDMGLEEWAQKQSREMASTKMQEYPPSWKPPQGNTTILVLDEEPHALTGGDYGPATVFTIEIRREKLSWIISDRNPVKREIIGLLAAGTRKIKVHRTGEKLATRYKVEAA